VTENTIEWNLAFAVDEVVAGVEKLLAKLDLTFARTEAGEEIVFHANPTVGSLSCTVRPLAAQKSPFNIQVTLHRTLLVITYAGFSPQAESALRQGLTLTFLRVGG
jgi:hypothetical protein